MAFIALKPKGVKHTRDEEQYRIGGNFRMVQIFAVFMDRLTTVSMWAKIMSNYVLIQML